MMKLRTGLSLNSASRVAGRDVGRSSIAGLI